MAAAAKDNNTKWADETTIFLELVYKQKCQIGWKQELNSTMHLELIPSQRPLPLRRYNNTWLEINLQLASRLDEPKKTQIFELHYVFFYQLLVMSVILTDFNKKKPHHIKVCKCIIRTLAIAITDYYFKGCFSRRGNIFLYFIWRYS